VTLTARVLSNGVPLGGSTVNFQVMQGSGTLSPPSATTDSSGYASTSLQLSAFASEVQVSACVGQNNAPCLTFYGYAVPVSTIQLQAVAGTNQIALAGGSLSPVVVRALDSSVPPNLVLGASVLFQDVIERGGDNSSGGSGGDTGITHDPEPIILAQSQALVTSDGNGLASYPPSTDGFAGALEIVGNATAGAGSVAFAVNIFPSQ